MPEREKMKDKARRVPIEMTKKRVSENDVYEKIDGKYVKITPSMIKTILQNGVPTEVYFARIDDEKKYRILKRMIDNENKHQERRGKCAIPDGRGGMKRCDKSCRGCKWNKVPSTISLEQYTNNGAYIYDYSLQTVSPEEIVFRNELNEAIHTYIDSLPDERDRIIVRMFMNGMKEREIAEVLGMTQANVNIRKNKIFKKFKIFLKDYL